MAGLNHIFSYVSFWCRATNAHGVHSPYVFDLLTRCFYVKRSIDSEKFLNRKLPYFKSAKLICRVLNHYNFSEVLTFQKEDINTQTALNSSKTAKKIINASQVDVEEHAFIYMTCLNQNMNDFILNLFLNPPDEFTILIRNIRQNKATFQSWNSLKNNPNITVSIDTYGHGFLVRRPGQVKEDFKIRL
jgi:hypothetical protein